MAPFRRAGVIPLVLAAAWGLGVVSCGDGPGDDTADSSGGLPAAASATDAPDRMELGTRASPALIASIDIDANSEGHGLPAGRGTHAEGAPLYMARCASCHGVRGEGIAANPRLVRAEGDTAFGFGTDVKLVKTPGSYWPYATTLYDYTHRAMPYNSPGSLQPGEVYALVAYLLAENGVISRTAVMDARTLPAVRMPARDRFVPDDRTGGPGFR